MNPLGDLRLILCSASPRRRELLQGLGLPVELSSVDIDETPTTGTVPEDAAEQIALRKAEAWSGELEADQILITADTVVVLEDQILGKPQDAEEAKRMLALLSRRKHQVITGVCLRSSSRTLSFSDRAEVTFKELSPSEIDFYVSTNKPFDKAGAYGIQEYIGYIGVEHLSGSYFNVMGLPLHRVYEGLRSFS